MCVSSAIITAGHVLHLDEDTEGLSQCDDVDVVTLLAHGFHFLMAELLDSFPTFHEVFEELALKLQVAEVSSPR